MICLSVNIATEGPLSEKKKILVFFGSPHKNGHTAQLLRAFLEPFRNKNMDIQIIDAFDEDIAPCNACGVCKTRETCRFHDFDEIDSQLRLADILVFATPIYNLSFPAPLKAIMDRTQRYYEARFSLHIKPPIARPKQAILLVTAGSANPDGAEIMEKQLKMIFTVMNTTLKHTILLSKTDTAQPEDIENAEQETKRVALAMLSEL